MKEAEIKVIFDNGGGKWLYYKGEDGSYIHNYEYNGVEQLVSDAMKLAAGESPIKEDWDGNEIDDYSPVFNSEKVGEGEEALFPDYQQYIGWWEV